MDLRIPPFGDIDEKNRLGSLSAWLALAEDSSAPQEEEVKDFYDAEQTNSHAESKETPDAANTSIVIVIV